jgi:hypothetical protein
MGFGAVALVAMIPDNVVVAAAVFSVCFGAFSLVATSFAAAAAFLVAAVTLPFFDVPAILVTFSFAILALALIRDLGSRFLNLDVRKTLEVQQILGPGDGDALPVG